MTYASLFSGIGGFDLAAVVPELVKLIFKTIEDYDNYRMGIVPWI